MSLQEVVALTAANHARMCGLNPRKGSIMIGADADIAICDLEIGVTQTRDLVQHGADSTPCEGMAVAGWPVKTLVRGALVVDDRRVVGEPGLGQFAPRETTGRH